MLGLAGFISYAVVRAESGVSGTGSSVLPPGSNLHSGARVPLDFSLARLGGGSRVDLARLVAHRVAVVNFFASWCPDCTAELDTFATAWRAHRSSVAFVGIDTNETSASKAAGLLAKVGAGYPVGVSDTLGAHSIGRVWELANGLPVTFFLDRRGHIALEVLGLESRPVLERRIAELLAGGSVR